MVAFYESYALVDLVRSVGRDVEAASLNYGFIRSEVHWLSVYLWLLNLAFCRRRAHSCENTGYQTCANFS